MTHPKLALIHTAKLTSIEDIVEILERLNSQLDDQTVRQFLLFNKAYLVVTRLIQHAILDAYFTNPTFIEKFIVRFARYYFEAINDSMSRNPDLSVPWAKLNEYSTLASAPVFMSLMLGANAHINNDLPQVLEELMENEKPENLFSDIVKIDKLLMESGKEIIDIFEENNRFLDFLKRHFRFLYYRPAMYTILYWRVTAWRNYTLLQKDGTALARISTRTTKIANRLIKIAKFLG